MSKHDIHDHCNHEVKYCKECDTSYCGKCSKEWTAEPCPTIIYPFDTSGTASDFNITFTNQAACVHS